jgi:hypothetical protein
MSPRRTRLLLTLAVALAVWLPRGLALDRYATDDEARWQARGANFCRALAHGDWAATYQREHPGVTVMAAGALALAVLDPGYAAAAPVAVDDVVATLRDRGQDPLRLLAAARGLLAAAVAAVLALAFFYASGLIGLWPAFAGFLLLAFDPFHVALSRLLHLDGLVSSLMLLSVLALVSYALRARRRDLIASAVAAALALLTKTPALFLAPFAALLLAAAALIPIPDTQYPITTLHSPLSLSSRLRRFLLSLAAWTGIAAALYFVLWPAMWVDPLGTLGKVWGESITYATGEHASRTFFAGRIVANDPGPLFYPLTFLWRATPVLLTGLLLALAFVRRLAADRRRAATLATLAAYALLYGLFITLGQKKLDRYLLPIFPPLDVIAGAGFAAAAAWLHERLRARRVRPRGAAAAAAAIPVLAVLAQFGSALATWPYFLTYYNPLLGGAARAPAVMMIGRGEGMDRAGAYLNAQPEAAASSVLVTNTENLVYTLAGRAVASGFVERRAADHAAGAPATAADLDRWLGLDFAVLYVHDWQRELLPQPVMDYFATLTPVETVRLDGLELARVYDLRGAPPPAFFAPGLPGDAQWGDAIRLIGSELPANPLPPGGMLEAAFYLQNTAPLDANLNLRVLVRDAAGRELARFDGWPHAAATSTWALHEVWRDGHAFAVPPGAAPGLYRVELAFYDPATLEPLDMAGRGSLGDSLVAGYVRVGDAASSTTEPLAVWGGAIELARATVDGQPAPAQVAAAPGGTLALDLEWRAAAPPARAYSRFLHLVDAQGNLVAQMDAPPLGGFVPADRWLPGDAFPEQVSFPLPAALPPGGYTLLLGLYDPATGARLTTPDGDAFRLAGVTIPG